MSKPRPPQFGLASLMLAITCLAVMFGFFKAVGASVALLVTVPVVWAVASAWSLRRTHRFLTTKSTWRPLARPFWLLLILFLVIAVPMLMLAVARLLDVIY